jgi:hypothetical protein
MGLRGLLHISTSMKRGLVFGKILDGEGRYENIGT